MDFNSNILFFITCSVIISVRFGSVRFGSVRFGSVRFGSVRFGSVRFGSVRFGSPSNFPLYLNHRKILSLQFRCRFIKGCLNAILFPANTKPAIQMMAGLVLANDMAAFGLTLVAGVVAFFQPREQPAQGHGHHQVNQGDGVIRLFVYRIASGHRARHKGQLGHGNCRYQ